MKEPSLNFILTNPILFVTSGLPSAQLRTALGLNDDQLPSYIYRMRELGLPPGWLKAAEIDHSGLSM